ncbi:MAG: hypothetical protein GC171_14275 [Terrimonas sp.]|nr:hypothetical protein [Terrimonas sp.]
MKYLLIISTICLLGSPLSGRAQELPLNNEKEQQFENDADVAGDATEDDTYFQELSYLRKHPVNLNSAGADALRTLPMLNEIQIENILRYRKLLGKLVAIYELQAVPGLDILTIRRMLPFITLDNPYTGKEIFKNRLTHGETNLLIRGSQIFEKANGYRNSVAGPKYLGGRERLFFRLGYRYKQLLQWGITGDKDAGEPLFGKRQPWGFDFYSFHFFLKDAGKIKALALGDYTVNLGQGLIQWQSLAFHKSAEVMNIKRQSPAIRPYTSAGEFGFNRGAAITLAGNKIQTTFFISYRKLSAHLYEDSLAGRKYISALQSSGYHRTEGEIADKNVLGQISYGGNIRYQGSGWHWGFNAVSTQLSLPLKKNDAPYNLFDLPSGNWQNMSMDYAFTVNNLHFFGEAAIDNHFHTAVLNAVLLSPDPRVDLSILHRSIDRAYRALYGNAFTENIYPENEHGIYAGLAFRPSNRWRINAYADLFVFPWLKYRVDAPSSGNDFLIQLTWEPDRETEIYTRFKTERKQINSEIENAVTYALVRIPRQSWRTQVNFKWSKGMQVRSRTELLWYDKGSSQGETGFLSFLDLFVQPPGKKWSANLRFQYFESDSYNSRVYAYENDVLYYFSIPAFFERGIRYYTNLSIGISPKIRCWVKISQSVYIDSEQVGSGLDTIEGKKRTEMRFQINIRL